MRAEDSADSNIRQGPFLDAFSIHPNIWMLENGSYQLPHLTFRPIINGTTALFDIEYHRDGRSNFGSVTLPEERTDIPENKLSMERFEFPYARFELIDKGNYAFWEGYVTSLGDVPEDQRKIPLLPIARGDPFRYRGKSFIIDKIGDCGVMSLTVRRISSQDEDQGALANTFLHPFKVFETPVDLTFPTEIDPTNLSWLIKNHRNLNQDSVQKEARTRLHVVATFPTVL